MPVSLLLEGGGCQAVDEKIVENMYMARISRSMFPAWTVPVLSFLFSIYLHHKISEIAKIQAQSVNLVNLITPACSYDDKKSW